MAFVTGIIGCKRAAVRHWGHLRSLPKMFLIPLHNDIGHYSQPGMAVYSTISDDIFRQIDQYDHFRSILLIRSLDFSIIMVCTEPHDRGLGSQMEGGGDIG